MPNFVQAGAYSAVMNYLKAVQAVKTDDAGVVMKQLKSMPINDMFARNGKIRADGRMVHDMYLVQVKAPDDVKAEVGLLQREGNHPGRRGLSAAVDVEVQDGDAVSLRRAVRRASAGKNPSPSSRTAPSSRLRCIARRSA